MFKVENRDPYIPTNKITLSVSLSCLVFYWGIHGVYTLSVHLCIACIIVSTFSDMTKENFLIKRIFYMLTDKILFFLKESFWVNTRLKESLYLVTKTWNKANHPRLNGETARIANTVCLCYRNKHLVLFHILILKHFYTKKSVSFLKFDIKTIEIFLLMPLIVGIQTRKILCM